MKSDRAWTARSRAGLAIPADLPSLDMDASIGRSCHVPPGGTLLEQDPPAFLPTTMYQLPPWPSPRLFDDWWWRMPPPMLDALIAGIQV